MKALRLTRPNPESPPILSLEEVSKPTLLPEHVIVKIHASAIHPSDIMNANGLFPHTTYPRTPGRDWAGVIVEQARGEKSDDLIGYEVFGTSGNTQAFTIDGAQAEFLLVPEAAISLKPKTLSMVQAATIGVPLTTALLAVRKSGVQRGETALVLGANGAVGSMVVQELKWKGLRVLRGVRGGDGDVDTKADLELHAIDGWTDGRGVNVVIDTVGIPDLMKAAIKKLAPKGRLVFIAAPRSGDASLNIDMVDFYRKEKALLGCNTLLMSAEDSAYRLTDAGLSFDDGSVQGPEPEEWSEMKLTDGVEAYQKAGQRGAGKFVLVMV